MKYRHSATINHRSGELAKDGARVAIADKEQSVNLALGPEWPGQFAVQFLVAGEHS